MANFNRTTQLLEVAGVNGVSRSTVETDWNNFGPRVGFAYQLDQRSVLKAGYGLFYTLDRGGIDNQLIRETPVRRLGVPGDQHSAERPDPAAAATGPEQPGAPRLRPRDLAVAREPHQQRPAVQRELPA